MGLIFLGSINIFVICDIKIGGQGCFIYFIGQEDKVQRSEMIGISVRMSYRVIFKGFICFFGYKFIELEICGFM